MTILTFFSGRQAACAFAAASLGSTLASAQSAPSAQLQEPIVVTASRSEQQISNALPATQVITRADIDKSGASDLTDLLRMLTSADIAQSGGAGKVTSAFLRGAESRHTLVLVDGVAINQADLGRASLEHLSLAQIERVEIVRGNLSALYGSQAVGGVIQVFTRNSIGLSATINYGSRDTAGASMQYGAKLGQARINAALSHQQTAGFSAQNPATYPGADADRDAYRNSSASLAITQQLAQGHELVLRGTSTRAKNEYDDAYASGTPQSVHQLDSLALRSDNDMTAAWHSRLDVAQTRERLEDKTGWTTEAKNTTTQIQWDNRYALSAGQALQLQLEHKRNEFDDVPSSHYTPRTTQSAGLAYLGDVGAWHWQLNVRHDKIKDAASANTANTYYAGLGYQLTQAWRLLGSMSSSYSAPSFLDMAYADPAAPALKPERGESRELGVQYAQGGLRVRLTAFDARIKDKVAFDPITFYTSNIARSSNRGADLSMSLPLPLGMLGLEASFNKPVNDEMGLRLLRRSRESLALNYAVTEGRWDAVAYVKYLGERKDIDPATFAEVSNPAQTRVDLSVGYRISPAWSLTTRVENLFNQHRDEVLGFTAAPRGLHVTLRYALQ